jgi:hypothetical protein
MFRNHKRRKVVAVVGATFLLITAGAYAYWSTTGAGTGTAVNGTSAAVTPKQTSVITGLYPGGPAVTLSGNFDNPNPGAVHVGTVTAALVSVTGGSGGTPACTVADYTLASAVVTINADIAAGNGVGAWTGPTVQLKNLATNQDACKNATLNLSYTSN